MPVPLSPVTSTVTSRSATKPIALYTSSMAGQVPNNASPPSASGANSPLGE
ncbi:MAG: hypothetical protein ABUS79_22000 [Pseudomonadota bacterium]